MPRTSRQSHRGGIHGHGDLVRMKISPSMCVSGDGVEEQATYINAIIVQYVKQL
jgi:hypothetical protein